MRKAITLLLTTSVLLAACGTTPDSEDSEPIKIGFIGPLTGTIANIGNDMLNAATLAVNNANDQGGIEGRTIELIAEDGRCAGADSASAAQKLAYVDQVDAIIGGVCSMETLSAAPIVEAAEIVMLSPGSSSPDITNAGEFIFRNYPNDEAKAKAMAQYFRENDYTRVAMISSTSDFSVAFRDALLRYADDGIIVFDENVDQDAKDFRSIITRLTDVDFDVVFPNISNDAGIGVFLQQAREQGLTQQAISHDYGDVSTVAEIAGEAAEGFQVINFPNVGVGTSFESDFIAAYGEPQSGIGWAAFGYDAANLLIQAMEDHGTSGAEVRDAFNSIDTYDGIVATISFDPNGDVIGVPYVLKEFQNGEIVKIGDIAVD